MNFTLLLPHAFAADDTWKSKESNRFSYGNAFYKAEEKRYQHFNLGMQKKFSHVEGPVFKDI